MDLLFDYSLERVLLFNRNKEPYKGKLNGIGGKVRPKRWISNYNDWVKAEMYREIFEETLIYPTDFAVFRPLVKLVYGNGVILHCFVGKLSSRYGITKLNHYVCSEGEISWYNSTIYRAESILAGDGNLYFLIKAGLAELNMLDQLGGF